MLQFLSQRIRLYCQSSSPSALRSRDIPIIVEENGQEALDVIEAMQAKGDITKHLDCIITDIEMPLMDGHRLTKLVKSDAELRDIPIIIFSSLVNEEMRKKGEQLGADAQLTKPEIGKLVEAIDKLIDKA